MNGPRPQTSPYRIKKVYDDVPAELIWSDGTRISNYDGGVCESAWSEVMDISRRATLWPSAEHLIFSLAGGRAHSAQAAYVRGDITVNCDASLRIQLNDGAGWQDVAVVDITAAVGAQDISLEAEATPAADVRLVLQGPSPCTVKRAELFVETCVADPDAPEGCRLSP